MKIKDPCAAAKTHCSQINTYFYKRCFRASSCCSTYDHQSATTLSSRNVVVVIQSVNGFQLFVTSWTAASQASLSFTISQSLLKLMSIESGMSSNHFTFCRPLLLLPSISPSLRVFFSESALSIRWPKYWSFRGSISPSNEYLWLISSRIDWFDLLAVQGTLKSLLKHHSSKALILQCSAFFMVQLSHPYMTTGKTLALTIWTFVSKVMSLLFNMLSTFVFPWPPGNVAEMHLLRFH